MAFSRNKMDQDDIEEEIFLHSMSSHLQLLVSLVQSNPTLSLMTKILYRVETVVFILTLLILGLSVLRFDKHGRVSHWFGGIFSCFNFLHHLFEGPSRSFQETEWSEVGKHSAVFSMQGRRPGNEDRAVIKKVEMVEGINDEDAVHIWAVMDGHGGDFCACYTAAHLIPYLEKTLQKLKLLTSNRGNAEKLRIYEKHFKSVSAGILKYLDISQSEYELITRKDDKKVEEEFSLEQENDDNDESKEKSENMDETQAQIGNNQPVLSSRNKAIEEVPSVPKNKVRSTPKFQPKPRPKQNKKSNENKKPDSEEPDVIEYLKQKEILYPKLIKDIVNQFDKEMLVEAKKANSIGGTTLILALLDGGQLYVGNVGDSRGVYGTDGGQAVPMSYDHKPCQLKEKKRIQEAGGYVAMNGVWRVMGVLATSRALGDYPLKDKKVVVSEPDVLSFSLQDHKMEVAVLASDGLWDTHTNEEAVQLIRAKVRKDKLMGAETLAREAFSRGSLDNITVLVVDLKSFKT